MLEPGTMRLAEGCAAAMTTARISAGASGKPRAGTAAQARLVTKALEHLPLAVAVVDRDIRLHYWNLRATILFGVPPVLAAESPRLADILEKVKRVTPRQRDRIIEFCTNLIADGDQAKPETWLRISLDRQHRISIQLHSLGSGRWLLIFEDMKPLPSRSDVLGDGSIDALTGLSNRRHFNQALRDMVQDAGAETRRAVLMIDLDRFKAINDTLGHPVGDALLCLVAQRLRRETREEDLIARVGGDEFVILLPNGETAEPLAKRVVEVLSRPFLVEGHIANIGASVRVACDCEGTLSAEDLVRQANLALCDAKAVGHTWRSFDPAMAEKANARRELETDLRKALLLGEFFLAYQPQFNFRIRGLTGFEALLRWNHPMRGPISPLTFIPVAEDIGCMVALGEWVLKTACKEAARWPASLSVAVNVSPRQLTDSKRLLKAVEFALHASGLAPARLELEITESSLMAQDPAVIDMLHQLRATGIRIAMDDFGTGYSSLSQLRAFPFDKIKIDRALSPT